jgi:hypothetical protein
MPFHLDLFPNNNSLPLPIALLPLHLHHGIAQVVETFVFAEREREHTMVGTLKPARMPSRFVFAGKL